MADLIVIGFKNESLADEVVPHLEHLHSENLLELADWARVIRHQDGKIDIRQATSPAGVGAAGGALFGMFFGLLFLMPLAGAAVGAITGAVFGKLSDIGISDHFIKDVGKQLRPGTSALFLYVTPITT